MRRDRVKRGEKRKRFDPYQGVFREVKLAEREKLAEKEKGGSGDVGGGCQGVAEEARRDSGRARVAEIGETEG